MKLFIKFKDLPQLEFSDVDIGDNPQSGKACIQLVGKSKVRTIKEIAAVDIEKMNNLNEFIDKAVTVNRLNQGLEKLREAGLDTDDYKNIGAFIKWVAGDVFREEADTIVENQFDSKAIGGKIAIVARNFYMNRGV